jgi:hypothetical protein
MQGFRCQLNNCQLLWEHTEVSVGVLLLMMMMMTTMSMGWDYVPELRPPTGLLFIPEAMYEHGEP